MNGPIDDVGLRVLLGVSASESISDAILRLVSEHNLARRELDCERQKLSEARAALRLCKQAVDHTHTRDGSEVIADWRYIESIVNRALVIPAPVAVPATERMGHCAHGSHDVRCTCPPEYRDDPASAAPDPVKAAYAECIAIVEKWRDSNLGGWTSAAIVSLIESAALRAGVKR